MSDSSRRTFLRGATLAAVATTAATFPPSLFAKTLNPNAVKLAMKCVGDVPVSPDVPPPIFAPGPPPPQLLAILPDLMQGNLKIQVEHLMTANLFTVKVLLKAPNDFLIATITEFDTQVEGVTLGQANERFNFTVMGRVVSTRTPSPFGDLLGRTAAYSGEFDRIGKTNFYFVGGFVAGSHTTWTFNGSGEISVNPAPTML